jgi:CheY-like chemotaxis protein
MIVMVRALVIDDDNLVGAAIQTILARKGIQTTLAQDAHAGFQAFVSSKFDVVVVDIFMPGMNGLETITVIRRQAPTIPLIAMSGFRFRYSTGSGLDFLAMAATLGATSCLRKPFAPQQLLSAIRSGLAPRERSADHRNLERDLG